MSSHRTRSFVASTEKPRDGSFSLTMLIRGCSVLAGLGLCVGIHASGFQSPTNRTTPPVISPAPGRYAAPQTVTITDSQPGAIIYYTMDGTTPTANSSQYTNPFTVNFIQPVQAIAFAPGSAPSTEVSSFYTVDFTSTKLWSPYNCSATGPLLPNGTGPTGTMTLTDTTTNQTLATVPVGVPVVTRDFDGRTLNSLSDVPDALIAPDINGDGKLDLVVSTKGEIEVLLGNGDGTFQPQTSVVGTAGAGPIAAGDFNGDGKPDLIYTIPGTSTFAVVPGNGDGTFNAPQPHSAGTTLYSVAIGDFNGDGKLDLAITNGGAGTTGNTILVLLGNGDGTFQPPASYTVGNGPIAISAGVFTSSGKLDLAVSNAKDGTVSLLVGNGDGTFQAQVVSQSVGVGPAMTVADFNRDGHLDLAVGGTVNSSGAILLGNGDGTFQYLPSLSLQTTDIVSIAAQDFSGDGIPDLLIGNQDFQFKEGVGNGNGTFDLQPPGALGGFPFFAPFLLAASDFNGDGIPDFVADGQSAFGVPSISFFANDSWATVSATFPTSSLNPTTTTQVLECSYSGDANYEASTSPALSYTFSQLTPPVFSLLVGVYNAPQTVTISDAMGSIYFTTDGSTPTTSSTKYTQPIAISTATTFKAIAAESGYVTSAISEAAYTFAATPQFSPPGGAYSAAQTVIITDPTPNTTIYYTTDGSTPTTHSPQYSAPIHTTANVTISALATASNFLNSAVASATYSVSVPATTTVLQASTTSGNPGQTITLTATVSGTNPTGTVSFISNGATLGTAPLSGGTASVQTAFATSGDYSITASYSGDLNNAPSVSSPVSVAIAAPDFSISVDPTSQTISAGQTATFTIKATPVGGYSGTLNLSCSTLPNESNCSFSPQSLALSNGPTTTTLKIATTATVMSQIAKPNRVWPLSLPKPLLFAWVLGIALIRRRGNRDLKWFVVLVLFASAATGCGGGSGTSGGNGGNPGTPTGTYTISVNAAGGSQGPSHPISLTLIVK